MQQQKIIVTGAAGQLGRELQIAADAFPQFAFRFLSRNDLAIEDSTATLALFQQEQPDWCINCAAYTAVDKAETEKEQAFRINGTAVGTLAAACRHTGARLVHLSTDYVFDGSSPRPLKEEDPTGPISVYGASKLQGEQLAMKEHADGTVILRTSWVYSEFGHNFVKTMIRLMNERPSINVVNDQVGSPTYAADLATAILTITATTPFVPATHSPHFVPGIYHYSNEGRISWYEFALAIKELTGSTCIVNPIPTTQFPTPAKRPAFSLLDKGLIRATYGLSIAEWKDSLAKCLRRLTPTPGS